MKTNFSLIELGTKFLDIDLIYNNLSLQELRVTNNI